MMSVSQIVDMGERLRELALPLYRGDLNAASLFAHDMLMRALRAPPGPSRPQETAVTKESAKVMH
jgi:hypothetical protein